jgi:two-component system, chemotaxis family, chemotaxis protein CheY
MRKTKDPARDRQAVKQRQQILVVDDSITMRLFYRSVLEAAGFHVDEAANGMEGYERILTHHFDLLIVDVNMPKMDGYTMIRAVRGDAAVRRVPAVFVSTESNEKDAALAYEAGANLYLVKPVDPVELTDVARLMTGVAAP